MLELIIVIAAVGAALVYVIRSLARAARGEECRCGTGSCSFKDRGTEGGRLPCQDVSAAIPAESLEESARNLGRSMESSRPAVRQPAAQ